MDLLALLVGLWLFAALLALILLVAFYVAERAANQATQSAPPAPNALTESVSSTTDVWSAALWRRRPSPDPEGRQSTDQ